MKKIILISLFLPILGFTQNKIDSTFNSENKLTDVNKLELKKLLIKYEKNLRSTNGIIGWSVQIKFTSKREDIRPYQLKFNRLYPEIASKIIFDSPYYKLTAGNFRTKNKALKIKHKISRNFPGAHHIKCIINPLLIKD